MTDFQPIPTPRRLIPGLPRWADLEPTIGELAATVTALPELRAALAKAEAIEAMEKAAMAALAIPEFDPPADADLAAFVAAARAYQAAQNADDVARRTREAADLRLALNRMVLLASGHELHDGIPVQVRRSSVLWGQIQIASNAVESRRYVEAEQHGDDGPWRVELGDLDNPRGSDPVVEIADEAEVLRVGLDHVLAPLRALAGGTR